jgi:phosphatidyl-myo-inositol dimannoside synthase
VEFDGEPTVLVVGRLEVGRCKGHDQLIACWAKVVSAVKGARLVIAGAGPDASRLRKSAAESPAKDSIEFLGFVREDDMAALWRRAHVFAMPSRGEGFGLVYIEAMRYGVPVIASIHDAGQEVNVDGETGYNVSLDRHGALGDRLVELLSSPSLLRQMGAAGRARWHELFRFSAFKRRFLPIFDAFLESGQWKRAASAEQAPALSGREAHPRTRLPTSSAARIDSLRAKANNYGSSGKKVANRRIGIAV